MISRSHKNHRTTARSTQRATSNPGSLLLFPAALRFLAAPTLLLLTALLLYPLQAADPLFQPSGTPRAGDNRGSAFKLHIRPSTPPATGTGHSTIRIPLPRLAPAPHDNSPTLQPGPEIVEVPTTSAADKPGNPISPLPAMEVLQDRPGLIHRPPASQLPEQPALFPQPNSPGQPSGNPLVEPPGPAQESFPIVPSVLLQEPEAEGPINTVLDCRSVSCEETIRQLRPTPLSSILLDVTPSFKPNLSEPPPRLQEEVRQWTDQRGMALASGQLADLKFGRVVIQLEDGSQQQLRLDRLSDVDRCYVSDTWGFPLDCQLASDLSAVRDFTPITLSWTASALCKRPGYFEDDQLERYGFTAGPWIQPVRSGIHFLVNLAIVPYRAGIHPPNECIYTLGVFRPGSPAPAIRPGFPISVKGGLWQAGVMTGGFYLLP